MRKQLRAAAVMVGVMASGGAWAGEEDVGNGDPTELPSPIAARLHSAFPAATVAGVERVHGGWEASIVEGGTFHEVFLARGDRRTVVLLDPDGRMLAGARRA
jgi:hypothetical protein